MRRGACRAASIEGSAGMMAPVPDRRGRGAGHVVRRTGLAGVGASTVMLLAAGDKACPGGRGNGHPRLADGCQWVKHARQFIKNTPPALGVTA